MLAVACGMSMCKAVFLAGSAQGLPFASPPLEAPAGPPYPHPIAEQLCHHACGCMCCIPCAWAPWARPSPSPSRALSQADLDELVADRAPMLLLQVGQPHCAASSNPLLARQAAAKQSTQPQLLQGLQQPAPFLPQQAPSLTSFMQRLLPTAGGGAPLCRRPSRPSWPTSPTTGSSSRAARPS